MREKIVEYNGKEYKIRLEDDRIGWTFLKIYERCKLLCFNIWVEMTTYWWDEHGEDENPIEFALEVIKKEENKVVEKSEYEKKLDEWFA